jgi:hypothetical protein
MDLVYLKQEFLDRRDRAMSDIYEGSFSPVVGISVFTLILLGILALFVASALLMWLWNITITKIFSVREITFWEAFRLIIIAGILFGGLKINT